MEHKTQGDRVITNLRNTSWYPPASYGEPGFDADVRCYYCMALNSKLPVTKHQLVLYDRFWPLFENAKTKEKLNKLDFFDLAVDRYGDLIFKRWKHVDISVAPVEFLTSKKQHELAKLFWDLLKDST